MTGDNVKDIKSAESQSKRDRSSIEFPYGDLNDAIGVAMAIHSNAGSSCTTLQLAAYMHQSATSGAFRLKTASARLFGLTENERGRVSLTDLGRRVVNPSLQRRARVEAFLNVPLYSALYNKYAKHMLPPAVALDREITQLGVAPKQSAKARQAFERSAEQAGFFAHGTDRLVMPAGMDVPETPPLENVPREDPKPRDVGGGGGGGGGEDFHPFIQGLIQSLPQHGQEWPISERVKWLRTAANIFDLIYEGGSGEVTVSGAETSH